MSSFLLGLGLGLFVAAQIGPISLLTIRTVMRGQMVTGVAIGAGAAVIDASYALLGVLGVSAVLSVASIELVLGLLGAAVLILLGARTLWSAFRVRMGGETEEELATPRRAFLTSLAATASNPSTIASWAAIFAAASAASDIAGPVETGLLVGGVGIGTLTWFTLLSGGVALLRRRVGTRFVTWVDGIAGTGLIGFGVLLGWRSATD